MKNRDTLIQCLEPRGYKEVLDEKSDSFGDYDRQFSSPIITVRLSSSKSFEGLDVCSATDFNNWYDVALLRALLLKENDLNKENDQRLLIDFFKTQIEKIEALFEPNRYLSTKKSLDELEQKRVSQMFPDLS